MNTLYYGYNVDIMKEHNKDESVDSIYLDPHFQSRRSFSVIFSTERDGIKSMIEEPEKTCKFEYQVTKMSTAFSMPRIQIVTAEQLFTHPIPVYLPNTAIDPFRKPDIKKNGYTQGEIEM